MQNAAVVKADLVELLDDEPIEIELATTLLYEHCHYPYRQIQEAVEAAGETRRNEIISLGMKHRGKHDELLRAYSSGQRFRFDILMDIGGFRDMHRHRRCVQIIQDFTTQHGYDAPEELEAAGLTQRYQATMQRVAGAVAKMEQSASPEEASAKSVSANDASSERVSPEDVSPESAIAEARESAQYAIPLAFKKRALFKMDFAEALYISELRTTPAGHTSYRNVAYAMYEAVAKKHPTLAQYFRVHDVRQPVDLLKR